MINIFNIIFNINISHTNKGFLTKKLFSSEINFVLYGKFDLNRKTRKQKSLNIGENKRKNIFKE